MKHLKTDFIDANPSSSPKQRARPGSIAFYIILAAAFYAMIQVYALLAPILLSFILILLITLAINPMASRLRILKGGRKQATSLALVAGFGIGALTIWAAANPIANAVTNLSDQLPSYWERIQRPLIKMEQQGVLTEEKLQVEVRAEIASETPEQDGKGSAPPMIKSPPQGSAPHKSDKGEKSLRSGFTDMILEMFGQIKGVALSATQMLIVLTTVFFGVTFTMMNPRPVFVALFAMVPERHHAQILTIKIRIAKFLPRWAGSMLISMLTIGSLFFLLMWPIFGFTDAILLGLIAVPLVAIVSIVHEELYRKRFLPTVTDENLDHLARGVLRERQYLKS